MVEFMTSMQAMSRKAVRDIDRRAIQEFGIAGVVLMENAGRGCVDLLLAKGIHGQVSICAGKGNNAGDGFVMARHLENHDVEVHVLLFCDPSELTGDAAINYRVIEAAGTHITVLGTEFTTDDLRAELGQPDWIVDALLGTGTSGNLREPFPAIIKTINQSGAKIFSVDLPSGMDCDTGNPLEVCIKADVTATFVARKLGFDSEGADQLTGQVHVIDIGVPRSMFE
jgi:NAD(P)H-hydrate epimerase